MVQVCFASTRNSWGSCEGSPCVCWIQRCMTDAALLLFLITSQSRMLTFVYWHWCDLLLMKGAHRYHFLWTLCENRKGAGAIQTTKTVTIIHLDILTVHCFTASVLSFSLLWSKTCSFGPHLWGRYESRETAKTKDPNLCQCTKDWYI